MTIKIGEITIEVADVCEVQVDGSKVTINAKPIIQWWPSWTQWQSGRYPSIYDGTAQPNQNWPPQTMTDYSKIIIS